MKINTLTISNFRGINGEFEINPEGENVVIVGPNGSGKSSVIAAIDFLVTGSIRELSGEGTQSLTANRHGPHIDADPDSAWVEAEFVENGSSITVRRSVGDRRNPTFRTDEEEQSLESAFESVSSAAERGLHLLSRNEILDFITAKAGTRSESIRTLLDLQQIKDRRRALDNAADHFENKASRFEREASSHQDKLYSILDSAPSSQTSVLNLVNDLRASLDGDAIADLDEAFTVDIDSPSRRVVASPLLRSDGRQRIEELQSWFENGVEDFLEADEEYRGKRQNIEDDEEVLKNFEQQHLIELGKEAIDPELKRCPLCLTEWDPEELEVFLSERVEMAKEIQQERNELEALQNSAQQLLTDIRIVADSLGETLADVDQFDAKPVDDFVDTIQEWEYAYNDGLLSTPPKSRLTTEEREALLTPSALESMLEELDEHIAEGPALDELEESWQNLQVAEQRYTEMLSHSRRAAEYRRVATDMREVHQEFLSARDNILNQIYDEIEGQFETYYTAIHPDESEFDVGLDPTETGLDMQVDFYDRGHHPPHALHSEGHQDSMGICLYFALFDWLQDQEEIAIMALDDVVMSIDADHRRPLAKLIATEIAPDNQLFITTHDDLWHRHLRSSGVVTASNAVQFSGWDIDDGPKILERPEMEWETIENELEAGNVSIAAHQTRRMAEWFLREGCDRLNAKVPFKADSTWTLGDFQQGVISEYKSIVRKAKSAADSWGREDRFEHFEALDDRMTDISERVSRDGAALNPNVHWNETESAFANCTPAELKPAVEAYQDLQEALWCSECNSCISLAQEGQRNVSVRCNCSSIHWNLRKDT